MTPGTDAEWNPEDDTEEEDSDKQWGPTKKACPYVRIVLALAEINRKYPPTLEPLLEAQYLDLEF